MQKLSLPFALVIAGLAGCQSQDKVEPSSSAASYAPRPGPLPQARADKYVVVADTTLYLLPDEAPQVDNPYDPGAMTSNVVGTLLRGRQVKVAREANGFCEVERDDGARGWARADDLQLESDVSMATVADNVEAFATPEGGAASGQVAQGSLLFVLGESGDFSQVSDGTGAPRWVPTSALVRDPHEVEVSKVISAVEWSKRNRNMTAPYYGAINRTAKAHSGATLLKTLREKGREPVGGEPGIDGGR